MTDRELMQQALDAATEELPKVDERETVFCSIQGHHLRALCEFVRAALAQPEPEPVAIVTGTHGGYFVVTPTNRAMVLPVHMALYAAPPQREWQTLTENEIKHLWYEACQTNLELTSQLIVHLARNIEAKLKEKNNG